MLANYLYIVRLSAKQESGSMTEFFFENTHFYHPAMQMIEGLID
jgi:hypothetical protein